MKLNLMSVLKILGAAVAVAPELIQAGKSTVSAVKAAVKNPSAETVAAAEVAAAPILGAASQLGFIGGKTGSSSADTTQN